MKKSRAGLSLSITLIAAIAGMAAVCRGGPPLPSAEQLASLEPLSASGAPVFGNFIFLKGSSTNLNAPPLPGVPPQLRSLNLPIYALGSNWFLIDDRTVDYAAIAETNRLEQAIRELEEAQNGNQPGPANGPETHPAGSLWLTLAMTNDATYGAMAAVTLNGTTNDTWYELLSKRSLADLDWRSEGSILGSSNQTLSQVTADISGDTAFLWARLLTNGSGYTLPIWWQLHNFGRTGLDPESVPGCGGVSLLQAYATGMEPNAIEFEVTATNNYLYANPAWVDLEITGGIPFSRAILVDSTDFGNGSWSPYNSTNLEVNLGSVEGWHDVWIGLRGFSTNSHETWKWKRLKLDHSAPQLSFSPAEGTVTRPVVQITGSCPEALSAIWYNLSNSAGVFSNQQVLIVDQYQDTNTWDLTTNTFQAFDVRLAEGTNLVTLHAKDLAGNHTATNRSYILDYIGITNAPSIDVAWPEDNAVVAAANVSLRGETDDPTAKVRARITGTNGLSRQFSGLVERSGKFWIDNIPLAIGTNFVTLAVTNAAGIGSSRALRIMRPNLLLTMQPVRPSSLLWEPRLTVRGTVSDPAYAVWVNGVKAGNPGDGTWVATNVPVTTGGVAIFQMKAYAPDEEQPDGSHGN